MGLHFNSPIIIKFLHLIILSLLHFIILFDVNLSKKLIENQYIDFWSCFIFTTSPGNIYNVDYKYHFFHGFLFFSYTKCRYLSPQFVKSVIFWPFGLKFLNNYLFILVLEAYPKVLGSLPILFYLWCVWCPWRTKESCSEFLFDFVCFSL